MGRTINLQNVIICSANQTFGVTKIELSFILLKQYKAPKGLKWRLMQKSKL